MCCHTKHIVSFILSCLTLVLVVLAGCTFAPPPPDTSDIIVTITAQAQAGRSPVIIDTMLVDEIILTPTPTPTFTPSPTPTPSPTLTPSPTITPTLAVSLDLEPPTPTPLFPSRILTEASLLDMQPLWHIGYGQAMQAALSPGGDVLAVGTTAGIVWVEVPSLQTIRFDSSKGYLRDMRLSAGGDMLATVWQQDGEQPATHIWWSADGEELAVVDGIHPVFSSNGKVVATTQQNTETGKFTTWLWRTTDGTKIATLVGDKPQFSADSEMVVTVEDALSDEPTTLVWRVADGALLRDLPGESATFSPDGQWLAAIDRELVQVWNNIDDEPVHIQAIDADPFMESLAFSSDGQELRIIGNSVHIWDLRDNEIVSHAFIGGTFGASDELIVTFLGGGEGILQGVQVMRVTDGAIIFEDTTMLFPDLIDDNERRLVAASQDGQTLALVTLSGVVYVVDLNQGTMQELPLQEFTSIAFNHDGRLLATAAAGPTVSLWRVVDGTLDRRLVAEWGLSFNRFPQTVGFSYDDRWLAVQEEIEQYGVAFSGAATVWDLADDQPGTEAWSLIEVEGSAGYRPWAFNPARQVAAWVNKKGDVELQRGDGSTMILTDTGTFTAIDVAPDGTLLAVGEQSGAVHLFRAESAVVYQTLRAEGPVIQTRFSPDATLVGTLRSDGIMYVWRVGEESPMSAFLVGSVEDFVFSMNNKMLVTRSSDEGIEFYLLADGRVVHEIDTPADAVAIEPVQWFLAVLHDGRVTLWGVE